MATCGKCGMDLSQHQFLYGIRALETHAQTHFQDDSVKILTAGAVVLQHLIEVANMTHHCEGLQEERGCSCGLTDAILNGETLLQQWTDFQAQGVQ